jgi:MFS superfamily sulfate permease-like transporter
MPDSTSAQYSGHTTRSLSAGAITGIVVGVVLGLAFLAAQIALMTRKRRKRKQQISTVTPTYLPEMDGTAMIRELGAPAGHKGSFVSEMDSPKDITELEAFKEPLEWFVTFVSVMLKQKSPLAIEC